MVVKIAVLTVSALLVVLAVSLVKSQDGDDVIDLQELLLKVATTLTDLKTVMTTCSSWLSGSSRHTKPRDCADLFRSGVKDNGVHRIWPEKRGQVGSFEVYCDMTTDGGGWTVFQKRGDYGLPQDYFYKTWNEYKNGFGELDKEFWIGNDRLFALTDQDSYELRIDLWDMDLKTVHAKYSQFWIENENQQYRLRIRGYSGDAGDSLSHVTGVPFSTKDRRNDVLEGATSCAVMFKGAWWYTNCHSSNLNGLNRRGPHETYADGIEWATFLGQHYSMATTEMKVRPADFNSVV